MFWRNNMTEETREWLRGCKDLVPLKICFPAGFIEICLVYADEYGRTISEEGYGPFVHTILKADYFDEKIIDETYDAVYEGYKRKCEIEGKEPL